jgi:hypothetical protein
VHGELIFDQGNRPVGERSPLLSVWLPLALPLELNPSIIWLISLLPSKSYFGLISLLMDAPSFPTFSNDPFTSTADLVARSRTSAKNASLNTSACLVKQYGILPEIHRLPQLVVGRPRQWVNVASIAVVAQSLEPPQEVFP